MKFLFAAAALLLCTSNAFAVDCPNLAGRYKWTDELDEGAFIKIAVSQTGCTNLMEEHDQGWGFTIKHKHVMDGIRHLVQDDGDFKAYEVATIDASGLHIMEERYRNADTDKPVLEYMKLDFVKSPANELVIMRVHSDANKNLIAEDKTVYKSL
jgi:hypothetical protein